MVCTLFVHRKGDVEEGEKKNEMEGSQNYTVGGGREERKDVGGEKEWRISHVSMILIACKHYR